MTIVDTGRAPRAAGPLRVGIVNIMPHAEAYEPLLVAPLAGAPVDVEPVWIRLASHAYGSSDAAHLARRYVTFEEATRAPLDGLILTGAPVEELPFEDVRYWRELDALLAVARRSIPSTLGLCWGALALAHRLGIGKRVLARKLFGVFAHDRTAPDHAIGAALDDRFWCAHSRHSGLVEDDVAAAAARGDVVVLARGAEAGTTLLASADGRYLMHVGHPEYEAARLAYEWRRDAGRPDVAPPANLDPDAPRTVWRAHARSLFGAWLGGLRARA